MVEGTSPASSALWEEFLRRRRDDRIQQREAKAQVREMLAQVQAERYQGLADDGRGFVVTPGKTTKLGEDSPRLGAGQNAAPTEDNMAFAVGFASLSKEPTEIQQILREVQLERLATKQPHASVHHPVSPPSTVRSTPASPMGPGHCAERAGRRARVAMGVSAVAEEATKPARASPTLGSAGRRRAAPHEREPSASPSPRRISRSNSSPAMTRPSKASGTTRPRYPAGGWDDRTSCPWSFEDFVAEGKVRNKILTPPTSEGRSRILNGAKYTFPLCHRTCWPSLLNNEHGQNQRQRGGGRPSNTQQPQQERGRSSSVPCGARERS